jgi:hypothetical protein
MFYFLSWTIGIDRGTYNSRLYLLYGPLNLLQLAHRRLLELPLRDHGIEGHGPDLVPELMDTIPIPRRHCHLPSWLRPSLSNSVRTPTL